MNPNALITVAIIIGAIVGAVAAYVFQRCRSLRLSRRFGSVDHAVVECDREGHRIAVKHAQGRANAEDLRLAMLHYRTFFEDLVGPPEQTSLRQPLPATSGQ